MVWIRINGTIAPTLRVLENFDKIKQSAKKQANWASEKLGQKLTIVSVMVMISRSKRDIDWAYMNMTLVPMAVTMSSISMPMMTSMSVMTLTSMYYFLIVIFIDKKYGDENLECRNGGNVLERCCRHSGFRCCQKGHAQGRRKLKH